VDYAPLLLATTSAALSSPFSTPSFSTHSTPGAHTTIFDLIRRLKALNRFWHASRPAGSQRALRLLQDVAAPAQDDRMRRMAEVSRRWATFCRPFDYLKKKKSLSQKKKFNLDSIFPAKLQL